MMENHLPTDEISNSSTLSVAMELFDVILHLDWTDPKLNRPDHFHIATSVYWYLVIPLFIQKLLDQIR